MGELGDAWLQDAGRWMSSCDPLIGYRLANTEGVDSLTTIKHGRERSIFFTDQIVDMVAYHTDTHSWVNGRSELNSDVTCNPESYRSYGSPPECATPRQTEYACNWHPRMRDLRCVMDERGNCCA